MAEPMTADEFLQALRAEGCNVRERDGWKTHNRNHKGAWGPLNGVMIHHTGGLNAESYVSSGDAALPGPLCHCYISKAGEVVTVGWGRANHAGGGDPDTLAYVIDERYPVPAPNTHDGGDGSVDGNAHFVGFECENLGDGDDPWPAVQVEQMVRATAAVLRHYSWSVNSALRHLDWSDWKSDPRGLDWTDFRARVAARLDRDPAPVTPTVYVSHLVHAATHDPAAPQGVQSYPQSVWPVEAALRQLGYLAAGPLSSDGCFGSVTVTAYAAFQRSLGYRGTAADGVPGKQSLLTLAARTGLFNVAN